VRAPTFAPAELMLAWAAALVGAVSVASALTPEMADRTRLVDSALPPGVPHAARLVALAFGLALVWLSRSLAHRRRRAWQLAVALVVVTAAAHLLKGLDVEEATAGLALLAALIAYRGRFDVPGDRSEPGKLLVVVSALAGVGAVLGLSALDRVSLSDRVGDLVNVSAGLLAFAALYFWLRPIKERVLQTVEDRREVRDLVARYGDDSIAYFALRRDKSWFFSPTRRSFLSYRVVNGVALMSGDPVGDGSELEALVEEFARVCRLRGWRLAVLGARTELLPLYRRLGLRAVKLGDEAVLRPSTFCLEGRAIRKVRQSVHRLARAGFDVRVVPAARLDAPLRLELERVSEEWRGNHPERGFAMAMDHLFSEPDAVFAVAEAADGSVGGFLHLVPSAGGGLSLSSMRRSQQTPNGLMEFLIAETMGWAREAGVEEISLNFCVFSDLLRGGDTALGRAARFTLLRLDSVFQLERLHAFSRKFLPEWRARYVCFQRFADAPAVGLACLRAEQLLALPGPWATRRRAETTSS
jgi:lysyl-tRNA synthetase, class II